MRKCCVLFALLIICVAGSGQIVQWTFEGVTISSTPANSPVITTGNSAADAGSQTAGSSFTAMHADAATVWATPTGNGSAKSILAPRWTVGDYYEFLFNTTGYAAISLVWDVRGSNTGPKDFKVQYSTDGTSFTDAGNYIVTNETWSTGSAAALSSRTLDLSAVTVINNQATVYIRLVNTSATSVNGATVAVAGTSAIDNFTVNGTLIAPPSTDFFRTKASGNWNSITTWESSPTGTAGTWADAMQSPTSAANTIQIRNGHTVTLSASASADQLIIENGGVLDYTTGTFTVDDRAGADVDIQNGGIFILSLNNTTPTFTGGTASVNIANGGLLRISAAGLTGAGTGVNASNFVYQHQSILEYTLQGGFASSGVTFFPNVNAATIPVFRVNHNGAPSNVLVGANATTTFNGVFENAGTSDVIWQNTGNKIFRNGIRGAGNISANASAATAKFIINGATAELGGSGSLTVPATGGLEIGTPTLVTMTSDKTVTGNVNLLDASQVNLGAFNLTVTGTVSNATVTSYVRTNGTGKLILNNISSGAGGKLFPIGLTSINPLFIQSSTAANYSARVAEPITPPIHNDNYAVLRSWHIASSVTSPGATISFGYTYPADCGSLFINTGPSVQLGVNVNNVWNIHQSGLTPAAFPLVPGTFSVTPGTPINTFTNDGTEYPFVVANNGAVLRMDYNVVATAQKINTAGNISWKVFNTDNVKLFEVQRSTGNGAYQTIGSVNPLAQSLNYSFSDDVLPKGTNLYRIKVSFLNGTIVYSNTVAVINDSKGLLITSLAPNPVKDKTVLTISSARQSSVLFNVYNSNGIIVKTWRQLVAEGNSTIPVDMSVLPAGIYYLAATSSEIKTVFKMIRQ